MFRSPRETLACVFFFSLSGWYFIFITTVTFVFLWKYPSAWSHRSFPKSLLAWLMHTQCINSIWRRIWYASTVNRFWHCFEHKLCIFLSGENNGLLVLALYIWLDVSLFAQNDTKSAAWLVDFSSAFSSFYFNNGYSILYFYNLNFFQSLSTLSYLQLYPPCSIFPNIAQLLFSHR